ncbi:alcohol dehydrogenase [Haloarcula mannanilytica]|uniref:Alcohol dehydrogenase n=1 Tax=Haloarcula mannanilytica TaxID=2509225 RepID=A0A4C2EIY4_9EURY|nr:NADPH:quinone oxidoreductase family protein [Haloarcula mannanilytica]GCF13310.1 alcohol dehydrogenase [Haloarcula mannanilytica]
MRVVRVTEHGDRSVLTTTTQPRPEPKSGEVRLRVTAAGVNFADIAKRRGTYPGGPSPPYTPGIEVAGRVDATGDGVAFERGERVMAYVPQGSYAESVVASGEHVWRVPDALSLRDAAGVPIQWLTAHNTLFEWGGLADGETVLVLAAAGGVGSAAIQLAVARTDATVLGAASTAEKRSFVHELGADETIDYAGRDLTAAVDAATDGAGIDLVLDGVGGDVFEASLDALAPGGRVVTYGLASGEVPQVSTPRLIFGNHSVVGYHLGEAADRDPDRVFGAFEPVLEALSAGEASVQVDRVFDLRDAAAAHEHVEDRRTQGKVLLEP